MNLLSSIVHYTFQLGNQGQARIRSRVWIITDYRSSA